MTSTNENPQPRLHRLCYTPREAAALLSVRRTKIYELMASGALESIAIGRSRRIPIEALQQLIADARRAVAA